MKIIKSIKMIEKSKTTYEKHIQLMTPARKKQFDEGYREVLLSELCIALMKKDEISIKELAREAGLSKHDLFGSRLMKQDIQVKNGITIPAHELEISTSRAGGAGGQHVNKTETRVTVRWNVRTTQALNDEQKQHVIERLGSRITEDGDLIVHSSASRSQQQNKERAFAILADEIRKALHVPKKRMKTKVSTSTKEARKREKMRASERKKSRTKSFNYD